MIHLLVSVLSYDIWFYISHILLHSQFLYKFHKEHHKKESPMFLDTYAGHFIESPLQGCGMFIPYLVWIYSASDTFLILLFLNVRGMMRHDERCVFLIGNHHLLHHRHPRYNFGEYWIDSLFGTKYMVENEYRYGLLYR